MADDEDNVYYNIRVHNSSTTGELLQMTYSQNRTVPILKNPDNYELAIVRFYIPNVVPIFRWKYDPADGNPLTITMKYDGAEVKKDLVLLDYCSACVPAESVWTYQQMLDMINVALTDAFTDLKVLKPAAPPTQAPFMTYDSKSQLCSFNAQTLYDINTTTIEVLFSSELYNRFFPSLLTRVNISPPSNVDIRLTVQNLYNNSATYNASPYYIMTQEYSTLALWNDIQTILLETDSIPVEPEFEPGESNKTKRIITDFEPITEINDRQAFQFYPQGPLRWYSLTSQYPLRRIDLKIFWQDRDGTVYPMNYLAGQTFTLKLRFRKKHSSADHIEDSEET
jgi:hypothetical protein